MGKAKKTREQRLRARRDRTKGHERRLAARELPSSEATLRYAILQHPAYDWINAVVPTGDGYLRRLRGAARQDVIDRLAHDQALYRVVRRDGQSPYGHGGQKRMTFSLPSEDGPGDWSPDLPTTADRGWYLTPDPGILLVSGGRVFAAETRDTLGAPRFNAYATDFELGRVHRGLPTITLNHVEVAVSSLRLTEERPEKYPDAWHHIETGIIDVMLRQPLRLLWWRVHPPMSAHRLPGGYQVHARRQAAAQVDPGLHDQRRQLAGELLTVLVRAADETRLRTALWSCQPVFRMALNLAMSPRSKVQRQPTVIGDLVADALVMALLEIARGLEIDPWVEQMCQARWDAWKTGHGLYGVVGSQGQLYQLPFR